ncbi:hypothetical protein CALVIDRAFT_600774 [Calocera viscosa TUFC12733]|uniref:Secreted protein n=1 Tax=Calocera viscosa (strain TUFC12733) TaxID=1330018 RepID=A0A167J7N9_CALVF|nr:hypothetical protein CALVIDRAFT_600774 [Calocera viscosa TUFC12733]
MRHFVTVLISVFALGVIGHPVNIHDAGAVAPDKGLCCGHWYSIEDDGDEMYNRELDLLPKPPQWAEVGETDSNKRMEEPWPPTHHSYTLDEDENEKRDALQLPTGEGKHSYALDEDETYKRDVVEPHSYTLDEDETYKRAAEEPPPPGHSYTLDEDETYKRSV